MEEYIDRTARQKYECKQHSRYNLLPERRKLIRKKFEESRFRKPTNLNDESHISFSKRY